MCDAYHRINTALAAFGFQSHLCGPWKIRRELKFQSGSLSKFLSNPPPDSREIISVWLVSNLQVDHASTVVYFPLSREILLRGAVQACSPCMAKLKMLYGWLGTKGEGCMCNTLTR